MARLTDRPVPLITRRDLALSVYLAAMIAVAWVVPERWWPGVCRALATANARIRPRRLRRLAQRLAALVGASIDDCGPLVTQIRANLHTRHIQYLRTLRPGGWSPVIRFEGREHIDAAIARGRGVVLWVSPLVFSDLVTKMALYRAGLRVTHLSLFIHGFSPTRFGFRVLNRVAARGEERFLAQRLVIAPGHPLEAIREHARRVREGKVVTISAVVATGQRSVAVPFLNSEIRLAPGAVQLARRTGATLLPVFTVRLEDASFRTTVEEPIDPRTGVGRDEAAADVVAQYATRLERYVRRWPAQYPAFAPGRGTDGLTS